MECKEGNSPRDQMFNPDSMYDRMPSRLVSSRGEADERYIVRANGHRYYSSSVSSPPQIWQSSRISTTQQAHGSHGSVNGHHW
jgi:hypothetical protein